MPDIFELMNKFCPDGVPYYRLDQVFDILQGYSPSMDKKEYWDGGAVPFFRMENLKGDGGKLVAGDTDMFCTMDSIRGKPFPGGSLIMATCATIGVHALVCENFLANQRFSVLNPAVFEPKIAGSRLKIANEPLDMDFANYYAFELDKWCKDHTNEGTFATVNMVGFRAFPWPVPPLQIQQEIVAILDKFNAYCNDMTVGLAGELAMRRKQYRYWRDKIFQDLMDEGCRMKSLGEICVGLSKAILSQKNVLGHGDYPVINAGRTYQGFYSDWNNEGNAITFSARGENAGCVNYHESRFWAGALCYPYRSMNENLVLTKFVYYAFSVREVWIRSVLVSDGGIPALNKVDIEHVKVPVPDMVRQLEIVQILDRFRELERELELRRKQYVYYRDVLLAFPEKKGA